VHERPFGSAPQIRDEADIGGEDSVQRRRLLQPGDLAITQLRRQFTLQDRIDRGRTAARMRFGEMQNFGAK